MVNVVKATRQMKHTTHLDSLAELRIVESHDLRRREVVACLCQET